MRQGIDAVGQQLPRYGEITRAEMLPNAQAQMDVSKQISPQYYELLTNLYKQFAPELARAGSAIDLENTMGAGAQKADALSRLDRQIDPEYYKNREATSGKLGELLSSINLNDANPEAERLVNQEQQRSGNITGSALNTTANALSFGDQLQKRRNSLGQAISAATQFLPSSKTGFASAASGPGAGQLQAMGQFGGLQGDGSSAYGQASELMGAAFGQQSLNKQLDDNNQSGVMKAHTGIVDTLGSV